MMVNDFSQVLELLSIDDVVVLTGNLVNLKASVTKIDKKRQFFECRVTESDDKNAIGKIIPINDDIMHIAFDGMEVFEGLKRDVELKRYDILSLIDLSLTLKNQDMFYHYCNLLEEYDKKKTRRG